MMNTDDTASKPVNAVLRTFALMASGLRDRRFKEQERPITSGRSKRSLGKISNVRTDRRRRKGCLTIAASNVIVVVLVAAAIIFLGVWLFTAKNAVSVYLGDEFICNIAEKDVQADELMQTATSKLKNELGVSIKPNETIRLEPVHASGKSIVSTDYALSEICNKMSYQVEACVVNVGGNDVAVLSNAETANQVLEQIKAKYVDEDTEISFVEYVPELKLENKFVVSDDILKPETAFSLLTQTTNEPRTYTVKSGDSLYKIAIENDMDMQDIIDMNDDIKSAESVLKVGQEIKLVAAVPVVSVRTGVSHTETVAIPKGYEYVDNPDEYITYSKVITPGADGEKEVVYSTTFLNGYSEGEDKVLSEKVIKEPVTEVVERGTRTEPPKRALGSFKYPTSGTLTSTFGARWGTTHNGIDLAASYGTPIYASDGGVVKQAGFNSGGYGYLVVIDHGNGFETYYGHNSKIAVSVGQKVAQGELIAYMGSTGNSTGNHCHFEIRKNGVPQNPFNYL